VSLRPSPKIALLTLGALAVPVPIGLASTRNPHRVQRATVLARPRHPGQPRNVHRGQLHAPRASRPTLLFSVSGPGQSQRHYDRNRGHRRRLAHAASDPADTISDFKFSPASITIHVGDTITWTNNGPTDHTATATNGSFDTGDLKKGQSASHTFTQAGTFSYVCSIHPFMHGTVVVVGSSSSSSSSAPSAPTSGRSGSGTGAASAPTAASSATSSGTGSSTPTLPNTGLDVGGTLGTALVLLGLGVALSRRTRAHR
jgi:plastocyanin